MSPPILDMEYLIGLHLAYLPLPPIVLLLIEGLATGKALTQSHRMRGESCHRAPILRFFSGILLDIGECVKLATRANGP